VRSTLLLFAAGLMVGRSLSDIKNQARVDRAMAAVARAAAADSELKAADAELKHADEVLKRNDEELRQAAKELGQNCQMLKEANERLRTRATPRNRRGANPAPRALLAGSPGFPLKTKRKKTLPFTPFSGYIALQGEFEKYGTNGCNRNAKPYSRLLPSS
jgi:hypothetical protein